MSEWDIGSLSWQPDLPVGHYECALSQVGTSPDITLNVQGRKTLTSNLLSLVPEWVT